MTRLSKLVRLVKHTGLKSTARTAIQWAVVRSAMKFEIQTELDTIEMISRPSSAPVVGHRRMLETKHIVGVMVPWFDVPFGGIMTIYRFASALAESGMFQPIFIVYSSDRSPLVKETVMAHLSKLMPWVTEQTLLLYGVDALEPVDSVVATAWESIYLVEQNFPLAHKYYLIQDFETAFYPAGSMYGLIDRTYELGYSGIINTKGLYDFITSRSKMVATYFTPGVDHTLFHLSDHSRKLSDTTRFFYGRPSIMNGRAKGDHRDNRKGDQGQGIIFA